MTYEIYNILSERKFPMFCNELIKLKMTAGDKSFFILFFMSKYIVSKKRHVDNLNSLKVV